MSNRFRSERKNPFEGKADLKTPQIKQTLSFNFKDLDPTQSKTFWQWQENGLLALACDKLKGYSSQFMGSCFSDSFKVYEEWPKHSKFSCPKGPGEDAKWASMHIQGKQCFGGHIVGAVFYIVFLDENHDLWPTKKKHT